MLPSSVAGGAGGIIDVTKNSVFVAQLNASTWIDAYKLVIRQNTADNTIVYNTGVIELDEPFYPTDSLGNNVPFNISILSSNAPLSFVKTTVSTDFKTVWVELNMPVRTELADLAAAISLSTDGGVNWNGTDSNKITTVVIKSATLKITFEQVLTGRQNIIRIANAAVVPVNDYFQVGGKDIETDAFTAFLEDSLVSLNLTSATVSAGSALSATVTGNKDDYKLSRNAVVSIMESGKTIELASRTQADNRISYSITGEYIFFNVGASIPAGEYVLSYTDNSLSGTPKIASASIKVIGVGALTYTDIDVDEASCVLSLTMNAATANAKDSLDALCSAIQLSVDGGLTWTGTTDNPVLAIGFTNTEKTYSTPAIHNMRIEFTKPLTGKKNMIKIPADTIKTGETNNVEIVSHLIEIKSDADSDNTDASDTEESYVYNQMVNGFKDGYKWTLTVWSGYDAGDPTANMIESFESCFDAKDDPEVTLEAESLVRSRTATWYGTYKQDQDIPIMWYRWVLTTEGNTVYDSGHIYSGGVIDLTYDSLISGKNYTITLTCVTQDGVEVSQSKDFTVNYVTLSTDGLVKAQPRQDGGIEVQCAQPNYITGVASNSNYWYTDDAPVEGHTIVSTGPDTSISFASTEDFDMDFSPGDTIIARIHSIRNGELLSYTSDDGRFKCSLIHRGLDDGLLPNEDLYPNYDLYPDDTNWGEFVYIVNGAEVATFPTYAYCFTWYTVLMTYDSLNVYTYKMFEPSP